MPSTFVHGSQRNESRLLVIATDVIAVIILGVPAAGCGCEDTSAVSSQDCQLSC